MLAPNDNTVNIKKPYHHGDLQSALVSCGMDLLKTEKPESLSLRQIARKTGVSPTAVYRHFPDKAALLRALAARGFEMLGEMQSAAARQAAAGGAITPFAASGAAYVRFALANPAIFRLMFTSAPPKNLLDIPLQNLSGPMRMLRDNITTISPNPASDQQQKILAIRAWSLVHGLAVLALDRMIPLDDSLLAAIITGAITPKPPPP